MHLTVSFVEDSEEADTAVHVEQTGQTPVLLTGRDGGTEGESPTSPSGN